MRARTRNTSGAIAGLGITEVGKVFGRSATHFAIDAVRRAVTDAGMGTADIDGLLTSGGIAGNPPLGTLQAQLNLRDLKLAAEVQAYGSSAIQMVELASRSVAAGEADVVVCVWADAPLRSAQRSGSVYRQPRRGWNGLLHQTGVRSPTIQYALAARRHMQRYGTTHEQLGAIAVAQRDWAVLNPRAQMRTPITIEDYLSARWVADPLRLLDCCLVSNGAAAVVVTSCERAADCDQPPVRVLGWGQSHPGMRLRKNPDFGLVSGAVRSGEQALAMAGVGLDEIDVFELYDCYTFTVLLTVEDYGLCAKGEGGAFVSSGTLGPNGKVALNTGGGQLSGYYLWGMTPLVEAIEQLRGQAGDRQATHHDLALVSGNGGVLEHHATLVLAA
jgi:acetyl-CoA acetyltransferase